MIKVEVYSHPGEEFGSINSVFLGWDLEESGGGLVVIGEHVFLVSGGVDPLVHHLLSVVSGVVVGNVLGESSVSLWLKFVESLGEVIV